MDKERRRLYKTARRETMRAAHDLFNEVADTAIDLPPVAWADVDEIRSMNEGRYASTFSILSVADQLSIPSETFYVPSPNVFSTLNEGSFQLTLDERIGNDLTKLHEAAPENRQRISRAANGVFFLGMQELLSQLAEERRMENGEGVMKDHLIEAVTQRISEKENGKREQMRDMLTRSKNNLTLSVRGGMVKMYRNNQPFYELPGESDFVLRSIIAGNLTRQFAKNMEKKSQWYLPPQDWGQYIPSINNLVVARVYDFLAVNNYVEKPIPEVISEYISGEIGEEMYNEVYKSIGYDEIKSDENDADSQEESLYDEDDYDEDVLLQSGVLHNIGREQKRVREEGKRKLRKRVDGE